MQNNYRQFFNVLIIAAMLICLASCNIKKNLTKTEVKTDSTEVVQTAVTQMVTETIDTCITIAATTLAGIKAIDEIQAGDSIFEETPDLEIITKLDHGVLKTIAVKKSVAIHIEKTRQTITKIDQSKKSEYKIDDKTKELHKEVTGGVNWTLIILSVIGAGIAIAGLKLGWFVGWKTKNEDKSA